MKKVFASLFMSICLVTTFLLSSCARFEKSKDKQDEFSQVHETVDEIFDGNYKEISVAELSTYTKQAKPCSILGIFSAHESVILRETGKRSFNLEKDLTESNATMKIIKGQSTPPSAPQVEYCFRETDQTESVVNAYSLYDNGQYAYTQEQNNSQTIKSASASKDLAYYARFSKMGYYSIDTVSEDMLFDIFSLESASNAKATLHPDSNERIEITQDAIYRDDSDDYVKIKIEFGYTEEEAENGQTETSTVSMQIFFLYDRQTNTPVAYRFSFYTTEADREFRTGIGMSFSIAPYTGTITPPEDLSSYSIRP